MWMEAIFVVTGNVADAWTDALLEAGASSVHAEDADADSPDEQALFGEPGEPVPATSWPSTRLTALLEVAEGGAPAASALLARAAGEHGLAAPADPQFRPVHDEDWVRATQRQFAPIPVGQRLWITPSWHLPTDDAGRGTPSASGGRHVIVLDPGLAFGTGSHPTTRLCLEWLDENLRAGATMIDYGCGSGILAIAAARLGARVVAIDIDAQALASARENARANGVSIELRSSTDAPPAPADVVVANILANPLRVLAPLLETLVAPGGRLVLAGLLERQASGIAGSYPHVALHPWRTLDGWTCLAGARRS